MKLSIDRYGNVLAHYCCQPRGVRPLVFAAHTDHPGFVALRQRDAQSIVAAFHGWVESEYFEGQRVRFWSGDRWVKGRISQVAKTRPIVGAAGRFGRVKEVAIEIKQPVAPQSAGMWDLPDPELRGDLVYARACDDLAGCAAMLALLERLSAQRAAGEVYCLFSRAEEVGFIGAIAAARSHTIPQRLPVISIETSKAIAGVTMGGGPILRVGDRRTIFTPQLTAFCERVAKRLVERSAGQRGKSRAASRDGGPRNFAFQRKLMDGGTCEATAYMAYGFPVTGICLALGNYHNMNESRRTIGSEYISLNDWLRMVDWFEALVLDNQGWGGQDVQLPQELDTRFEKYLPLLTDATAR